MSPLTRQKELKEISKISIALITVLLTLFISVFTGCGGSSGGGNNNNNNPQPPTQTYYSVSFITNGGSSVAARSVQQGSAISASPETTRSGYVFDGWFTDNNTFVNKVSFPYTVTQNITLYAKWTTTWIEIWTPVQLNDVRNNLSGNYRLMADISLSSYANWEPIGTVLTRFTGELDGNGYRITNLKIDGRTEEYSGLFGYISGGTITNLALENVNIFGGRYVGALAGYINSGTIKDSHSTGDIVANDSSSYAGGIAGYQYNGIISNCYSTGNITANGIYTSSYAGGIAGYGSGTIRDSYSMGDITAYGVSFSPTAGGIAGGLNGTITRSYSTGNITASDYAGGIVGYVDIYSNTITNSYSTGSIVALDPNSSVAGRAGGIAGSTTTPIKGCYSTGNITASNEAGGIVGYTLDTITNSYSTGNITARFSAGGIAGSAEIITNSYSTGNITTTSGYAGGIAASVSGDPTGRQITTGNAAINETINANSINRAGRIIGSPSGGTASNNFALDIMTVSDTTELDLDTRRHGISRTDAQFRSQSTYENGLGWKFGNDNDNPWKMPSGGGYPILYWQ